MKVLLRNAIPTPAVQPDLTIVDGVVTQGTRVYTLSTTPGVYFIMPYNAQGTVPHYNNKATYTASWRNLRDAKETQAVLNASFYRGFIAAYVVSESGDTVLLINNTVTPAPDVATYSTVIDSTLAGLSNEQVLRKYVDTLPTDTVVQAKTTLMRKIGLNDAIANLQLQVDILVKLLVLNPPANKPDWYDSFIASVSGSETLPNPLDRKGIPTAIAEVKKDRDALNELISTYKSTT